MLYSEVLKFNGFKNFIELKILVLYINQILDTIQFISKLNFKKARKVLITYHVNLKPKMKLNNQKKSCLSC